MTTDTKGSTLDMVIVDFGTKTSKQIQRLRKGEGKLADDVRDTVDELKRGGIISKECQQPVVVVVKELPGSGRRW